MNKFFINKSVEALIPLKEGYQGLLELHVPLEGIPVRGEKWGSKKEILFEAEK